MWELPFVLDFTETTNKTPEQGAAMCHALTYK
jgi:hypothetical protein